MNEIQEKQIQITNLNIVVISPKPGQTFANGSSEPFNKYEVTGNDGIKYETFNAEFYNARTLGEQLTIKYQVLSNSSGGRVYTNYKLVTDNQSSSSSSSAPSPKLANDGILNALRHMYKRIEEMENKILVAMGVKPQATEKVKEEVREEVKEEVPVIQLEEEIKIPVNDIKPVVADNTDDNVPPRDLPF